MRGLIWIGALHGWKPFPIVVVVANAIFIGFTLGSVFLDAAEHAQVQEHYLGQVLQCRWLDPDSNPSCPSPSATSSTLQTQTTTALPRRLPEQFPH